MSQNLSAIRGIHEIDCILKYFEGPWPAACRYMGKFWPTTCFEVSRIYVYALTSCRIAWNIAKNTKTKPKEWEGMRHMSVLYNVKHEKLLTCTHKPTDFFLLMLLVWPDTPNSRLLSTQSIRARTDPMMTRAVTGISSRASEATQRMPQKATKKLWWLCTALPWRDWRIYATMRDELWPRIVSPPGRQSRCTI